MPTLAARGTGRLRLGYLTKYYPTGVSLYPHYTANRGVTSYVTSGAAISNQLNGAYCVRAANKHYVFCQAWQAAGLDPNRVKLLYGSQFGVQGTIVAMVSAITQYNLPQDYIAYSAYYGPYSNPSQITAACPAGYAGNGSSGNWPVDAINDLTRHYMLYGSYFRNLYSQVAGYLTGTALKPMGYEGGPRP